MQPDFSSEGVRTAITRYLDGAATGEELRGYLAACDAAIDAGRADRQLSGPVGRAALALMEQDEGVRPPADVRSALTAIVRTLAGEPPPLSRRQRSIRERRNRSRSGGSAARGALTRKPRPPSS
jgi:hypothetical protein